MPSRPFYAGTEGDHCQGACRPQWFFYVRNWDGTDIKIYKGYTAPMLKATFCHNLYHTRFLDTHHANIINQKGIIFLIFSCIEIITKLYVFPLSLSTSIWHHCLWRYLIIICNKTITSKTVITRITDPRWHVHQCSQKSEISWIFCIETCYNIFINGNSIFCGPSDTHLAVLMLVLK